MWKEQNHKNNIEYTFALILLFLSHFAFLFVISRSISILMLDFNAAHKKKWTQAQNNEIVFLILNIGPTQDEQTCKLAKKCTEKSCYFWYSWQTITSLAGLKSSRSFALIKSTAIDALIHISIYYIWPLVLT